MKLERLTLLRLNMGNYRSSDALPPLSMSILAARTPADVEVSFFDDKVEQIPHDDTPDLVALTVETFTARRAYELADAYRERGVTVVMGGYHPSFMPDEALQHADAIVVGDAEGVWENLLQEFKQGKLQRIYSGSNHQPLNNYIMDRSIFKNKRYVPVELVQFGRGCRFNCDFCSIQSFYNGETRTRSLSDLIAEIEALPKNRLLFFVDDNLFNARDTLDRLLKAMTPLKRRWSCQISIDVARDDKLLDMLAEAGCIFALVGFESLSEENLKQMGKSWNRVAGDYREVVKKFHHRGMAVYGTFVFGYDHDTEETIRRSLAFALESRLEIANFNPLTPTPGTPLYERLEREGRLLFPQWWLDPNYRYGDPIFVPKSISPERFTQCCFEAKQTFYSWRSITTRLLTSRAGFNLFRTSIVGLANVVSRREVYQKQYRNLGA